MSADLDELRRLRRARDRMDREYALPLDVPALARTALMSTAHFSRRFRDTYGETPYSYLMTRRIERAKALLRRGDLSVTDVCFAVGATSLGSFSARFTELVGQSPSAYRAANHDELADLSSCQARVATRPRRRKPSSFGEAMGMASA
ncbi:MAG TPA: helix-turn-helix transcriptional regulator [Propionicimonas sp.]|jgi:AraC-like DNA-binding protein|uniref:helix-turn-helix transcriptional regulator n=1 Tax=Propionicimonas sp. TaxID=1955623 RepID=UPI002F4296A9